MDHYKNAPQRLRNKIELLLTKLEATITQESRAVFAKIILSNPNLNIYSLGLFYNANSWDFILPTFASEEGLQYLAENHSFNAITKIKMKKIALRWSICDSPHHDDDAFLYMMPITKMLLKELSSTLDYADPVYKQYEWPDFYLENYHLLYEFQEHVYQLIQETVISGLRAVWKYKALREFFILNNCALTLSTEAISDTTLLNHIKKLNTETTYQKLKEEIKEGAVKAKNSHDNPLLNSEFLKLK